MRCYAVHLFQRDCCSVTSTTLSKFSRNVWIIQCYNLSERDWRDKKSMQAPSVLQEFIMYEIYAKQSRGEMYYRIFCVRRQTSHIFAVSEAASITLIGIFRGYPRCRFSTSRRCWNVARIWQRRLTAWGAPGYSNFIVMVIHQNLKRQVNCQVS